MNEKNLSEFLQNNSPKRNIEHWFNSCLEHCRKLKDYSILENYLKNTEYISEQNRKLYLSKTGTAITEFLEECH